MATVPERTAEATAEGGGRTSRAGWRILRTLLIGIAVSLALLIVFPPLGLIKDHLAQSLGAEIGRTVAIDALRVGLVRELRQPRIDVELDGVTVANPDGMAPRLLFHGGTVKTRIELLPLLKGRVRMESLALVRPTLTLEEDADGRRNWVFPPAGGGTGAATAQPAPSTAPAVAAFSPPPVFTVAEGTVSFQSAKTGVRREASGVASVQTLDAVTGAFTSKGSLVAGGESVAFDAALGDFDAMLQGASTALKATLAARALRAEIDGDAQFSAAAEFTGDVALSTPSLIDLAVWFGADATASGEPLRTSLEGRVHATTRDVTFAETDVMINTTSSRFDGTLDLGGVRPKLAGAASSEHIDLGRLLGRSGRPSLAPEAAPPVAFEPEVTAGWERLLDDLRALERGPAAEAAPSAAVTASASGWSEQPFHLKSLSALDLDMTLDAAAITYGGLDLKQGRVKAALTDGVLDAKLDRLAVGAGQAVGTLTLDSRASPPRASMALTLSSVAAEPIVTELTGKPLLAGTSNVEITATAAGQNQSQLTQTLDGKARFQMGRGALRGFDVRRMIFEWWKSWTFDLAARTGFERLDAQYDIRKGVMRSTPGLTMGGAEVEISSAGTVSLPSKRLDQEIRVKAIPPPTAFPIPVRISGDWAKPSIGIDWGGLFSAGPGLGGPQALAAAPEPPPPNVEAAIRRVLAADVPADRLSPEARQMLQSLLPEDEAP